MQLCSLISIDVSHAVIFEPDLGTSERTERTYIGFLVKYKSRVCILYNVFRRTMDSLKLLMLNAVCQVLWRPPNLTGQNCANMVLKTSTTGRLRTVAPAITNYKVWALALIRAPTPSLPKTLLKPLATSFVASTADLLWGQESARQSHFKTHGQANCSSGPTLNDSHDPQTGTF